MRAAHTTFDRQPKDLPLLVSEWRYFGRGMRRKGNWEAVARWWAAKPCSGGGAIVMLSDDSLAVFTKRGDKVSRSTYKPGTWSWEKDSAT